MAVIDDQQLRFGMSIAEQPGPLRRLPPTVNDPQGWLDAENIGNSAAGERVLMLGYPKAGPLAGKLAGSVGTILTDQEAGAVLEELRAVGDEEGDLAYDPEVHPEVEWLVRGTAIVGMSGGGVFSRDGQLVGILVRGTTKASQPGYTRIVKLSFIMKSLGDQHESASPEVRSGVQPFLPPQMARPR